MLVKKLNLFKLDIVVYKNKTTNVAYELDRRKSC